MRMIEHHPISAKNLSRLHQFGKKVLPGVFLGCVLYAVSIWKGDIWVADIASEIRARRLNAKEVITRSSAEHFKFPIADGTVMLSGRDQVFRRSTSIQHPARGEKHNGDLQGESDWSQSSDTLTDDGEARHDF